MTATIPTLLELPTVTDARGELTFAEADRHVPHPIRRVFHVHHVAPGARRGEHGHRTLHETLIAVAGSFAVTTFDGETSRRFALDSPRLALHVPPMHWIEMVDFAPASVCLVLASEVYVEADYLRDRDEFVRIAKAPR